jgi:hypothetical protein
MYPVIPWIRSLIKQLIVNTALVKKYSGVLEKRSLISELTGSLY